MKTCLVLLAFSFFLVSCGTTYNETVIYPAPDSGPPKTGWKPKPKSSSSSSSSSSSTKKSSTPTRTDQAGNRFRDVAPEDMEPAEQILRVDR